MLDILKFIRGYLRIRVNGFSPERFMNLCSNKDILLWDIEKVQDGYEMSISLRSFRRLKAIVRKTRTKVVVLEKNGLPFLFPLVRKRSVFVTCFLLAILFWHVSGLFIWDIVPEGNLQITTDQLNRFLREQGIREGMRRDQVDISVLEKELRNQFQALTWTSARVEGTRLIISMKENDGYRPDVSEGELSGGGTDLVAEADGVVVSMVVRQGIPAVKIGDTVTEGTVLVDGRVPIYNEDGTVREYLLVDADADILLEHMAAFDTQIASAYMERRYTSRQKQQYFLRFGRKREWKVPLEKPYTYYDRLMRLGRPVLFEKLEIPVFIGSYTYREYQNVERIYSAEEAGNKLEEEFLQFLQTLEEKGVQIIEKDVKIDTYDLGFLLHADLRVQEQVTKRQATDGREDIREE
ncbi:MAG: sporulation protein YqfD [Lachnospiraceae bacterium]|nr:sporulation protein YqfD [Lachnospiraceae bacterium]